MSKSKFEKLKLNEPQKPRLHKTCVIGSACFYCKGMGKIFHWEFGQFVKCGVCQADR